MIGQGMSEGAQQKVRQNFRSEFSEFINEFKDELVHLFQESQYEKLFEESFEFDVALKKMQPKNRIKIKVNNGGDIPDCHYPHQIIQTHLRKVESISEFVLCAQDCRVQMLPTYGNQIKISLITCATEKMCEKYFKMRGSINKYEHQLYIIPPQIEHKLVTCLIEYPIDKQFKLEQIDFETFMGRFKKEPEVPASDSSDLDF
ncbi:MAG: hypothetical protein AMXMBFR12_08450 [Candidatus Babeliales bacterium]